MLLEIRDDMLYGFIDPCVEGHNGFVVVVDLRQGSPD